LLSAQPQCNGKQKELFHKGFADCMPAKRSLVSFTNVFYSLTLICVAAMFFFALGGIAVNFLNFAILGHAPKLKNAVGT